MSDDLQTSVRLISTRHSQQDHFRAIAADRNTVTKVPLRVSDCSRNSDVHFLDGNNLH